MGCCKIKLEKPLDSLYEKSTKTKYSLNEASTGVSKSSKGDPSSRTSETYQSARRRSKQKITGLDPRLSLTSNQEKEIINGTEQKSGLNKKQRNMIIKTLTAHFIFSSLSNEYMQKLVKTFKAYTFEGQKVVFSQGHSGQNFYIIESGSVEVLLNGERKAIIEASGYFGEMALIYDTKRTATIKTLEKMSCWVMRGDNFREAIHSISKNSLEENKEFLLNLGFYNKMTDHQKDSFLSLLVVQVFKPGQRIVREGEKGQLMYLVKKGQVSVSVQGIQQRVLGPGEYFGEQTALYKINRTASVDAIDKVLLLCFNCNDLVDLLGSELEYVMYKNSLRICIEKTNYLRKLTKHQRNLIVENAQMGSFENGDVVVNKGNKVGENLVFVLKGELTCGGKKFGKFSTIGEQELYLSKTQNYKNPLIAPNKAFLAKIPCTFIENILSNNLKSSLKRTKIVGLLKTVPIFRNLPSSSLEPLIPKLSLRKYSYDQEIFNQGDAGEEFFIIKSGQVEVFICSKSIRVLSKHDSFGERSLLFNESRTASIVSKTCQCWVLQKNDFLQLTNAKTLDYIHRKIELQNEEVEFEDLALIKMLGKGTFGTVFLAQNCKSGNFYALKSVQREKIEDFELEKNLILEKKIMSMLDHPFIDKFIKSFKDNKRVYFLMELVEGIDLFDLLRKFPLWDEEKTRFYISCIILILEQLHEYKIIHRDLKPENIIIDRDGYPKLIDFGVAKIVNYRTYTVAGSSHYMAPEVIKGTGYGIEADYWSLGIILYEFLCNKVPWGEHEEDPIEVYNLIIKSKIEFPAHLENLSCKNFIQKLLNENPAMRGDIGMIKQNAWLAGVDYESLIAKMIDAPFKPQVEELNKGVKGIKKGRIETEKIICKYEDKMRWNEKRFAEHWDFEF